MEKDITEDVDAVSKGYLSGGGPYLSTSNSGFIRADSSYQRLSPIQSNSNLNQTNTPRGQSPLPPPTQGSVGDKNEEIQKLLHRITNGNDLEVDLC